MNCGVGMKSASGVICGKQPHGNASGNKRSARAASLGVAGALFGALALAACNSQQVMTHGAVISADQIDLVPVGSSRDQVLLAMGSPSTTGSFDSEIFYYISQKTAKTFAYQKSKLVDQRIIAVYFDAESVVTRIADYGLQDGKVFDFISRTTPTGGKDLTFLGAIFAGSGKAKPINPLQRGAESIGGAKF